jgi:hypothetical protein
VQESTSNAAAKSRRGSTRYLHEDKQPILYTRTCVRYNRRAAVARELAIRLIYPAIEQLRSGEPDHGREKWLKACEARLKKPLARGFCLPCPSSQCKLPAGLVRCAAILGNKSRPRTRIRLLPASFLVCLQRSVEDHVSVRQVDNVQGHQQRYVQLLRCEVWSVEWSCGPSQSPTPPSAPAASQGP